MTMLSNPKTTVTGYLMLGASVLLVVAHVLGGGLSAGDLTSLLGALGGVGLIAAKDGGQ